MPNVNIKGRYRIYTHDGTEPLPFTSYSTSLCSIRRPNPNTFITISTYIPGSLSPFTTFDPGSSYTIVTRSNTADFSIGPYVRAGRLPSSVTFKSPNFYHGLDKNSITVAISSYALSVNAPLSTVFTYIPNQDGFFVNSVSFNTDRYKQGLPSLLTHLTPNSSYQFINRTPYTFFAPLQSEMGDAYAWGDNNGAYGMGYYLGSNLYLSAHNLYGVWDKIVVGGYNDIDTSGNIQSNHILALSSCGAIKKLFVTGANNYGQLGTGDIKSLSVWTAISGEWSDIAAGYSSSYALSTNGKLFATGWNDYGQLGITSDTSVLSATTFTQEKLKGTWSKISSTGSSLLALSSNGKLFGCGYNLYGQLGLKNYTPSIYTLTQEASGGVFTKIFSNGNYSFAISGGAGGRVLGTGYNNNGQLGIGSPANSFKTNTFVPELCGFTNVTDVYFGTSNTAFIKTNESTLRGAGFNTNNRYLFLSNGGTGAEQSPQTFQPTYVPNDIKAFLWIGGAVRRIYTVALNNTLKENIWDNQGYFNTPYNYFNLFSGNGNRVFFALSARNDLRPTPTPTVTPSSTPSILYPPVNVSEVGIFGGTFVYTTDSYCRNVRVYNTPGSLSNNFTYEVTNNYLIPPGNATTTTFDYEKSSSFNNIVGISLNKYYPQTPNARNNVKYLWKKVGSNWTYTLLPSSLDSGYYYRTFESGGESLFISAPHPSYGSFFSQGIYSYVFADISSSSSTSNNNKIMLAMSYDRGNTWELFTLLSNINSSIYDECGATSKVIFSRSRESDYKVRLVGNTGFGSPYGRRYSTINGHTLYYYETFRNISMDEVVDYASPLSIKGHDFKHDYFNIPTVASTAVTSYPSNRGQIRLSRRIKNVWQTNVVIDNITDPCFGPCYQVPGGGPLSFYNRAGSPIISMEFDPTNPDLVYIAYLRGITQYTSLTDPGKINVCCYNMKTNTLVFDESVVFAKNEPGSPILRSTGVFVDIPTLYFDTTNNTLNLFFFGVDYVPVAASVTYKYYKTKRLGTNSWAAITNLFVDTYPGAPGYNGTYMTNCWELKTKY